MSVCLESNNVLANQVSTRSVPQLPEQTSSNESANTQTITSHTGTLFESNEQLHQQILPTKTVTKLLVSNHQTVVSNVTPVLQKIANPPVITVLNSTGGPLTVLKTICVTSGISSTPHFSLVNNQPLTVTNALGKSPTITLLNAPVTMVKVPTPQTQTMDKSVGVVNTQNIPTIIENKAHNVFVKNTCTDPSLSDVPQSHKFLTANSFPQTNVIATIPSVGSKIANGQRNKMKIIGNVVLPAAVPGPSHNQTPNLTLNKSNKTQQRLVPRQKVITPNNNQTKYVNKLQNNVQKSSLYNLKQTDKIVQQQQQPRLIYPTHKSQIKTLSPVNNYMSKVQGIKTLTPHQSTKSIPIQLQKVGSGLRTIPPQRPQKLSNKLNYIGKHAVQAHKVKTTGQNRYNKSVKQTAPPVYNNYVPSIHNNKQLAFNQALTAEILETLGNKSGSITNYSKSFEIVPARIDSSLGLGQKQIDTVQFEDKTNKSGLDTLSLICQAVLLDHNYNATLPPESPTRSATVNTPSQINGMSGNPMLLFSPGSNNKNKYQTEKKRTLSCSNPVSTSSSVTNLSTSAQSINNSFITLQEDDAASDISDCSYSKRETEGEETDTAPEAEAVTNDEPYDHYGDYVTRCICGFLHDDGYMVECDHCKVWQHVQCVVKNKQIPDEYLCEKCNPTKTVDPHKARLIQQQWLRERQQLPDLKNFKEERKSKNVMSDTDSSDTENPKHNNNILGNKIKTSSILKKKFEKQPNKKKELKDSNIQRKKFKKREKKIVRRKSKLQSKNGEEENGDIFSMTQLPQLKQWIENYEEAVTNHYSPELRARISNIKVNGSHTPNTIIPFDSSVNKCRIHTQPLTDLKYLVTTVNVAPDTPIIELRGKYMLSTQHRNSGGNLNTRQHSQRPGPFLFFYCLQKDNTEVCVDTRTYGNSARFIRRSCTPNAELRHCIEKGVLHLYIVTILPVDKNNELTIKHESHDLAAVGTTQIACYCGNSVDCKINKTIAINKNGENSKELFKKRRGRRIASGSVQIECNTTKVKEEKLSVSPLSPTPTKPQIEIKEEIEDKIIEVKKEPVEVNDVKEELEIKDPEFPIESQLETSTESISESIIKDDETKKDCPFISTRRSSSHKPEKEKDEDDKIIDKKEKHTHKKLSREERKLEAILRAIEQMEKADQRKHEHKQIKHVQRRESEPSPHCKDEEKSFEHKQRRKRRKGRARTASTHSARRDRLNSGDSYFTSGDENMISPNEGTQQRKPLDSIGDCVSRTHNNLLLALSVKHENSTTKENDLNSNTNHSSPETPLSLACSLVQAAVEPLEPGFKLPKTKKDLMNEWLNKTPESVQSVSYPLSPHIINTELDSTNIGFFTPTKNICNNISTILTETSQIGSAKKRWLRQAINEDKCDSPQESPPLNDSVAPPKKRRLPRESLSNDNTPPNTPTSKTATMNPLERLNQSEGCVEIVYSGNECEENINDNLESDAVLKERAAEMKQEFSKCLIQSPVSEIAQHSESLSFSCLMDPRLRNHHSLFTNSDHLVGTVEKTLSIFGFEEKKTTVAIPAKRKLSITEYRQRKKLNNNDLNEKSEDASGLDECGIEENSSESFKAPFRSRSNSSSSSCISSDNEPIQLELPTKVPAFNSEPTELERQREMQSLRRKTFGLSMDVELKKTAIDVDSLLSCNLPTPQIVKSYVSLNSPKHLDNDSCNQLDDTKSSSVHESTIHTTILPNLSPNDNIEESVEIPLQLPQKGQIDTSLIREKDKENINLEESEKIDSLEKIDNELKFEKMEEEVEGEKVVDIKPHMFYTPDEEEVEDVENSFQDSECISYVPPFNNPIYPNSNYTSIIDEDGRYEGRNPSPPPSLESVESEI